MAVQFTGTSDWWLWRIGIACFAAVGGALVSQYGFDMRPCPWCTLQRLIYLVIGTLSLIGAVLPGITPRRVLAGGSALLAMLGIAAAGWQHFVAAASDSCSQTLADRILNALGLMEALPALFEPTASCAEASVTLLGVPYAIWSLVLFLIVFLGSVQVTKLNK